MPEVILISKAIHLRGPMETEGMKAVAFLEPFNNAPIFLNLSSMQLNLHTPVVGSTDRMVRGGTAGRDDVNPTARIPVESTRLVLVDSTVGVSRFSATSDMDQRGLMSSDQPDNRVRTTLVDVSGPRVAALQATAQWISDD